jgi:hypothetical protein
VTFRSRTLYQLSYNSKTLPPIALGAEPVTFRSRTLYQLSYNGANRMLYQLSYSKTKIQIYCKTNGGQGRIRTSVARKERQIYSLLPLTTRPPVRLATRSRQTANGNAGIRSAPNTTYADSRRKN